MGLSQLLNHVVSELATAHNILTGKVTDEELANLNVLDDEDQPVEGIEQKRRIIASRGVEHAAHHVIELQLQSEMFDAILGGQQRQDPLEAILGAVLGEQQKEAA